jgi:hypothetical protein
MEKNPSIITTEKVINKIFTLRDKRIMLDRDLAGLYGVKSIRLREQVKRNIARFPENFMFQLTAKEVNLMVSQIAIPSRKQLGGSLPYAFTEHGILMLANVLRSKKAIQVSVRIIEIFVKLREMVLTHKDILLKLEILEREVTTSKEDIGVIFTYLKKLLNPPREPRRRIGYRSQKDAD